MTDLNAGALEMAVCQRKRAGADLTGLIHHLRPWGAVPAPSVTDRPWGRLGGIHGDLLSASRRLRRSSSLYKAEAHPLARPPDRGHRRLPWSPSPRDPLVRAPGPTAPSACAPPRRARSRLGTRHQPRPPPGTTATGQRHNWLNRPSQDPEPGSSGVMSLTDQMVDNAVLVTWSR